MEEKNHKSVSWRAAEKDHREKSLGWYIGLGTVALILIIIALFGRNFFFGIFIIFAFFTVVAFSRSKPRVFDFKINERGLIINDRTNYAFESLDSFCLRVRSGELDELILKRKTTVNPFLKIQIDSKTSELVRPILKERLREFEYQDSIVDFASEWLGF